MTYRPEIDNYEINGKQFESIKNILDEKLKVNIKKILQVRLKRYVYQLILDNNTSLRLDIFSTNDLKTKKIIEYQILCNKTNINIPKVFILLRVEDKHWKVSKWIEGIRLEEVWNQKDVFYKCGKLIATLNNIKDPESNNYLAMFDFNKINLIWTKNKEVFIIDVNMGPKNDIDISVVKNLVMGLRTKNRCIEFLHGYNTIRSIEIIEKLLKQQNWKWKNFCLLEDDVLYGDY